MENMGKPSRVLTFDDAIAIWRLRREGWLQSRIAAHFDTNQGRISEVLSGKRHPGSEAASMQREEAIQDL